MTTTTTSDTSTVDGPSTIVEPTYTPDVQAKIDALRADILATIARDGVHFSPKARWPSKTKGLHWRDVYAQHRHSTRIIPTPDPRSDPSYTPPSLSPSSWPDWHLHRFLVARRFDVHLAREMFIDHLAWRSSFGVDDLSAQPQCPWADLRAALVPERIHHTDREGRPVYVACYGPIDVDRFLAEVSVDMMYVMEAHRLDRNAVLTQQQSEQHHRRITQISVVLDAGGCSLHHRHLMKWVEANDLVGQPNYPEFLYQLLFLNTPSFMPTLWSVVKRMLDERIRAKMSFLSSNYHAELEQRIGRDHLPREWGGTCTRCVGDHCLPRLEARDEAEERRKTQAQVAQWAAATHSHEDVHLPARHTHPLHIPLHHRGGTADPTSLTVWYRVDVASKDVDVSMHFTPAGSTRREELIASHRVHHGVVDEGFHQFLVGGKGEEGVVTLVLSNAMSMFSGKQVSVDYGVHEEAIHR